VTVSDARVHQGEVTGDRSLQYEFDAVEEPDLFGLRGQGDRTFGAVAKGQSSVDHLRADARARIKARDARAAGAQTLRQRALGNELHLEFTAEYWRANSRFSPTYEPVVRRMRFSRSSMPSPNSSTPQLLLTVTRSLTPVASTASISTDGNPQSPNPPTARDEPLAMSATASAALATTLSIPLPLSRTIRTTSASDPSVSRT